MTGPSTPPAESDETDVQFTIDDVREAAEHLADLAAFIERGFCNGLIMVTLPVYTTMKHIYNRLNGVAYKLCISLTPSFVFMPRKNTTLDIDRAIEVMGQLAAFFDKTADIWEHRGLANAAESELAQDLRLVMRYTKMLTEATPERFRDEVQGAPEAAEETQEPEHDAEAEAEHEPAAQPEDNARDKCPVVEVQESVQSQPATPAQFEEPVHFDLGCCQLSEPPTPSPEFLATIRPVSIPERGSSIGKADHSHLVPRAPIPGPSRSAATSDVSTPAGAHTPHDIRPARHTRSHAPHPLQGPRLKSRAGVPDNEEYAELCSFPGKVLHSMSDVHNTVQIGHSNDSGHQHHQYIEASILNFDGIDFIKLVHPFCGREMRSLDYDTLRYLDIVLKERKNTSYSRIESLDLREQKRAERAEARSREIVERELGCRAWEMDRGVGSKAYEGALDLGETESIVSQDVEEQEPQHAEVRSDTYDPPRTVRPENSGTPPPEEPDRMILEIPLLEPGDSFSFTCSKERDDRLSHEGKKTPSGDKTPSREATPKPEADAPQETTTPQEPAPSLVANTPNEAPTPQDPTTPISTPPTPEDPDSDDSLPRQTSIPKSTTSDGSSRHRTPQQIAHLNRQDPRFTISPKGDDKPYRAAESTPPRRARHTVEEQTPGTTLRSSRGRSRIEMERERGSVPSADPETTGLKGFHEDGCGCSEGKKGE